MPDAYENINMAMRSILTTDIGDNEDPYFQFNDLTSMSSTSVLSPFSSSGSQGNMSMTSPMSTSSSPMHITDDYINLTNAVTILGEPYISVLVQPMEKFRFRYKSEMVGTHGSLLGVYNGRKRNKNNVPTVKLHNYLDKAIIRCTLVTTDEDLRIPHAHRLVRRVDSADIGDPHYMEVSSQNDFTAEFVGMGIIHTARRHVKDEIVRKLREEALEERKRSNIDATLNLRDDAQIKADAEQYQKTINLNSVSLCFQGFIKDEHNIMRPITAPVYSNSVNNLKSALTGELKICRIDKYTSSCEGGEEVFILVEKVSKKNIKIKFFELDDDDTEIWMDYGRFSELDVHHQYAMVFRTPAYRDRNITSPKEVFIQLERPSDSYCSEPIKFTYKPTDRMIGRKRTRISHSNSAELVQALAFNNDILMNTSLTSTPLSNDSTEISKEIKKMLDDRCSSSEFRDFVEHINLDMYETLLNQGGEDKLTYDGAPSKKDDKLFAKDVIIDTIKDMKMKPREAKDIIKISFKDRTTYGDTPLHCALRYGQKNNVKRILMLMSTLNTDAEELVNIRNSSGKTPLHYAASQDQPEIIQALLMLGADPNITDHYGQMPLHRAVKFLEAEGSINILLAEKDVNIEANTDYGWSPLQLAAQAGSYHAVYSLIKAGADVNNTDMTYGRTALHIAVEGGHKDIVEFLLKNTKIDVNKKNFSGNTALHTAIVTPGTKAKEICALLVKYGADPHIRNYNRELNNVDGEQIQDIKVEVHSEDENMEECNGQSSFDLASNKPDILQLVSGQNDMLINNTIKEENINDTQKVWMDIDQEKQLASILDETKGWKKLAHYFDYKYLMNIFKQTSSSSLLLLNYIAIQTNTSLSELTNILQNIGEEDAATYMSQILSMKHET
ncbi:nuclear factor NF-kappa-B p105 subunit isoform X1 [Mycetomoellerius zeteki]|uniref:nuclear factor NF-kappa-B p105 subunit isoform X1 n=1 Tax=Mycetomoellerius zeteki TaxID=64791 RepID=UPI00084EC8F3|nr:PREDICTED: nuclear factor NF-kappa-B p105 subunit isoform X1 [Trachymyrmex zeteki]